MKCLRGRREEREEREKRGGGVREKGGREGRGSEGRRKKGGGRMLYSIVILELNASLRRTTSEASVHSS